MSYSPSACLLEFTPGQIQRMQFAAQTLRSNLTCSTPPVLTVDYRPSSIEINGKGNALTAGESIAINLKVRNNGGAAGQANGGFDKIYFNSSPDLSGSPQELAQIATPDLGPAQNCRY